jgi:hypothetical protein
VTGPLTWERGSTVRGAFGGLLLGFGASLVLTQLGWVPLTVAGLVIGAIVGAIVGAVRGWWGTPYRGEAPAAEAGDAFAPPPPPGDDASPPPPPPGDDLPPPPPPA